MAFNQLKAAVASPPVLALPDFTQPFLIECDASGFGLMAVLIQGNRPIVMQEHNQKLFPYFILDFPWIISDCNVVICLVWIDI